MDYKLLHALLFTKGHSRVCVAARNNVVFVVNFWLWPRRPTSLSLRPGNHARAKDGKKKSGSRPFLGTRGLLSWGLLSCWQVVGEYGMAHFSDEGKSRGKDYCIFFNSQWARLPQDLNKAVSPDWAAAACKRWEYRYLKEACNLLSVHLQILFCMNDIETPSFNVIHSGLDTCIRDFIQKRYIFCVR